MLDLVKYDEDYIYIIDSDNTIYLKCKRTKSNLFEDAQGAIALLLKQGYK